MAFLAGLKDYLSKHYEHSIFEQAAEQTALYTLYLHDHMTLQATITANKTYEIILTSPDGAQRELQKIQLKMLHPAEATDAVKKQISFDESVQSQRLKPITRARQRNFIKNKNLFPLMREQQPLTVTLLEGEILQGIIESFSRYEITLALHDQQHVTILRHALLDICNKQGCCFLKSSQQTLRDWTKSSLYIDPRPRSQLRPGLKKSTIKRRRKVIIR